MIFNWCSNCSYLALLGGLIAGSITSTRFAVLGKVTGISGIFNKSVSHKFDDDHFDRIYKTLFIIGILAGGYLSSLYFEPAFEDWSGVPLTRLMLSGLLVGFGTVLGKGCTSGHGICGISALRLPSLVATCIFMTTGIITASLTNTLQYLPPFDNTLDESTCLNATIICIAVCLFLYLASFYFPHEDSHRKIYICLIELLSGIIFAVAMSISNMTKLSATISFLDLNSWNPALIFVMMGAIGISMPVFYFSKLKGNPLLNSSWNDLPPLANIDMNRVSGAAIFGIGWGLVGACPAPALTNALGNRTSNLPVLYIGMLVAGMYLKEGYDYIYEHLSNTRGTYTTVKS